MRIHLTQSVARGRRGAAVLVAAALACAAPLAVGATAAQNTPAKATSRKSVWDGVYTDAQASRGQAVYTQRCAGCHRPDLTGNTALGIPALAGARFEQAYGEDTLDTLYLRMRRMMPRDEPGSLSDDTYLAIVAYVLQVNAFPGGSDELKVDTVANVRVQGKNGPGPAPDGSLVKVVGCLTRAGENAWKVTSTTEPVRTSNPNLSEAAEMAEAQALRLGTQSFRLRDVFPSPLMHMDHKVEVKGFLMRVPNDDGLNVTSVQTLDTSCGQ